MNQAPSVGTCERHPTPPRRRARRLRATLLAVATLASGATCRDSSPTGPGLPSLASLAVAPVLQVQGPVGGPRIPLARLRARIHPDPTGADTMSILVDFVNDTARIDAEVFVAGSSQLFRVHLEGVGPAGDTLFRGDDTVRVFAGEEGEPAAISMAYAGPDANVTQIVVSPGDTTIDAPDSLRLQVSAVGASPAAMYVGWTSRDPVALPVSASGTVRPRSMERSAWIVARLYNGTADSAFVRVRAPVASLVLPRDTATVVRGSTLRLLAEVRDSSGTVLEGRTIAWSALDTTVAVDGTGLVTARVARATGRVVAEAGGRADTATITVAPRPVDFVDVEPFELQLAIGDTARLRATAYDAGENVNPDWSFAFASSAPAVATVDASSGLVTAQAAGTAWIRATAGGVSDSALVTVAGQPDLVARGIAAPDTVTAGQMFDVSFTIANPGSQGTGTTQALAGIRDSAGGTVLAAAGVATPALAPGDTARLATVLEAPATRAASDWQVVVVADCPVADGIAEALAACLAGSTGAVPEANETNNVAQRAIVAVPGGSGITSVVVTPALDTLESLGDTLPLAAQAMAGGTPAEGSFTWTSRTPGIATVSATGTVTAVANGESWIVAVEAGGASDSALVVVRQRVSTVSLTPNSVSRYLGRSQQFAASAVDARGNPVAFAAFSWSSTAPAVVSIDSTGLATMVALGSATVRATAGGITGQADVTVLTPITRIVVSPDSSVMDALGLSQRFSAVAYDTLDAPMNGVQFTWTSSNPSVASVALSDGDAIATSLANGTTRIRATAQGVTGEGLLVVRQVLVDVEVTPTTPVVAPGGRVVLMARGLDRNRNYLSTNPVFAWSTDNSAVATVDAGGVVSGVAQGSVAIRATAGERQGWVTVFVQSSGVPTIATFGRDTIKLGRGLTTSIPVYLSVPSQSPVILSLAARDTNVYFPKPVDTIPAGQTVRNVTIGTRNAGSVRIVVSGTGGYAADSSVVTVTANVRFATSSLAMVATDQRATQVVLSDPAPAGGVYVAFSYGTPGIVDVSPDPVFIQAGLLSAPVTVRGMATGSSVVSLSANGLEGANTLTATVSAAALSWYYGPMRLGSGQYQPNHNYIYFAQPLGYPLTITFSSSDSTLARLQPQVVIPAGQTGAYVESRAFDNRTGIVTVTASAPGWTSASTTIRVDTPVLDLCCDLNLNTTSGPASIRVYPRDSLNGGHNRINSLRVQLVSRDTSIAKVDSAATIGAGDTQSPTIGVRPVGGGTTWIVATAGGHRGDSVRVNVAAPALAIYYGATRLGAGQYEPNANYVYLPNAIATPVTVNFSSSDTTIARAVGPVIIAAGQTGTYFRIEGYRPGAVTYTATATGYTGASQQVSVTSPRAGVCCGGTVATYAPDAAVNVYSRDSLQSQHPLLQPARITLVSTDTSVLKLDRDTVTIAAGSGSSNVRRAQFRSPGTARVIVTGPEGWLPDTVTYTVTPAALAIYYTNPVVAAGQIAANGNYLYVPNARGDTIKVAVQNRSPGVAQFPDTIRIPAGANGTYFSWEGIAPGRDTVTFSAPGYTSVTGVFPISRRLLRGDDLSASLQSTTAPFAVRARTIDTVGTQRDIRDSVTVRMISSDTTVLRLDSQYVHIRRGVGNGLSSPNTARILRPTGGDSVVYIIYQDSAGRMPPDTSNAVTVRGPRLYYYYGPPRVGMRQVARNANYVYTENAVGAPVVVTLTSSNTDVLRSTSVTIPAGSNGAWFDITGGDTLGVVRLTATATGYAPANLDVDVGKPRFALGVNATPTTTSPSGAVNVYLRDHGGNTREAAETLFVTLVSTQPGVAALDSTTIRFLPGQSTNNVARLRYLATGTTRVIASDPRNVFHAYLPDSATVTVSTPPVQAYYGPGAVGPGQFYDNYVYVPNAPSDTLRIALRHDPAKTALPDTVKIPPGQTGVYFRGTGISDQAGTDTVTFVAAGHASTSTYFYNGPGRTSVGSWPGTLTLGDSVQLTLYSLAPDGNQRSVAAAQAFTLSTSGGIAIVDAQGVAVTSVTIPANGSSRAGFWVKGTARGTGTLTVSRTGYTSSVHTTAVP